MFVRPYLKTKSLAKQAVLYIGDCVEKSYVDNPSMEVVKLRLFAEAYYKNSPREVQQHANKFFQDMDTNRDGYVTLAEFTEFLHQNGYNWVNPQMFAQLDANGDGRLDLWEVLTFYYILKTRCVWCDGCRAPLHELYFTCVKCFDAGNNTYDLCAECYCRRGTSGHQHTQLVDSYVLLRSKRGISGMNVNMVRAC